MMQSGTTDYRTVLKTVYSTRCSRNARYSMRAFARDIGVAPSRLSEVLSGKAGLSRINAMRIAQRLGFSEFEREHFGDLVDSLHARSSTRREIARVKLRHRAPESGFRQLEIDRFHLISGWHHLAILELTQIASFEPNSRWIGEALGIAVTETDLALDRLQRLGLISRQGRGRRQRITLTNASNAVALPPGKSSAAIREFHRQILEKALHALEFQPVEERDFSNLVVAFRRDQMPELRRRLKEFRHRLSEELGGDPGKDSLYALSMQFFRLDQPTKGKLS